MFFENMKLALKSMWTNKLRTILSLLGIVIGVASVVAILTLGQSATKSITETLEEGGLDTVYIMVTPGKKTSDTFDEIFGETLRRNVDGIRLVFPMNSSSTRVRYKKDIKNASVYGVDSAYAENEHLVLADGSWFSPEDNITKRQVVVIGSKLAEDLFPSGNAVGQYVSIFRRQSKRYQVIGVLDKKDSSFTASYDNTVFIPYNTYTQKYTRVTNVSTYVVKVDTEAGFDALGVTDDIEEYLDNLVGSDAYNTFSSATLSDMASSITGTLSTFLAAIAGISLLVGGIGIMNIMLVSVAERTKEIGIRKALGANPRVIRGQFITEAVVLTLIGGFIGIILGTGLSKVVTNIAGWNFHISVSSYIISVGFSMFIGVFFGWYPAKKASKLDPIEALNYE